MFAWTMLIIAGICEIFWGLGLKLSDGFRKPLPTAVMIVFSILSLYFLALSIRQLPLGLAYAVWGAIGAVGIMIGGHFLYGEHLTYTQIFFVAMIIIGTLGVKISA